MTESTAVALVAIVGIIGLIAIAYTFIKIMINTTREAYKNRSGEKKL
jgi:hypothetical protein